MYEALVLGKPGFKSCRDDVGLSSQIAPCLCLTSTLGVYLPGWPRQLESNAVGEEGGAWHTRDGAQGVRAPSLLRSRR